MLTGNSRGQLRHSLRLTVNPRAYGEQAQQVGLSLSVSRLIPVLTGNSQQWRGGAQFLAVNPRAYGEQIYGGGSMKQIIG